MLNIKMKNNGFLWSHLFVQACIHDLNVIAYERLSFGHRAHQLLGKYYFL